MHKTYLNFSGIALIIVYLTIILIVARIYSKNKYEANPKIRKYFIYGLAFKLLMALAFAYIYDVYYRRGGDVFYYFDYASRLGEMIWYDPINYFKIFLGFITKNNVHSLPIDINYIPNFSDPAKPFIHRLISPFTIVGFQHFYLSIICLATFLYAILWKGFRFLCELFPNKEKILAISFLFIPSVGFWGSGFVKEAFAYSFIFVFIASFYRILMQGKLKPKYFIYIVFSAYLIIGLKPYILYALLVAMFIWLGLTYTNRIKSRVMRVFVFPLAMLLVGVGGVFILNSVMQNVGGAYSSIDSMMNKAVIAQQDLKQEYYQGTSFDIGDYEASFDGVMSVTPSAIIAGLYRPFLWEARSTVVAISGLENLALLLISLFVFIKVRPRYFFWQVLTQPFISFCFVFAIIMAMGIGLSTSNFGALVRFKIPLMPFFLFAWLFIYESWKERLKVLKVKSL
ncbi:MAG: hypothetical protein GX879_11020 [Bacteroidales bacterium]|nr:hypothetical protein [Bacteroidales bacterium]